MSAPTIQITPQNPPSVSNGSANLTLGGTDFDNQTNININVNPTSYIPTFVANDTGESFPGAISSGPGALKITEVTLDDLNNYHLVITRPSGVSGEESVEVTATVFKGDASTANDTVSVTFVDPPPPTSPPDTGGGLYVRPEGIPQGAVLLSAILGGLVAVGIVMAITD